MLQLLGHVAGRDVDTRAHHQPQGAVGPEYGAQVAHHQLRAAPPVEAHLLPGYIGAGAHGQVEILLALPGQLGVLRLAQGKVLRAGKTDNLPAGGGVGHRRRVHEQKAVFGIEHAHIERHQVEDGLVKILLLFHALLGLLALGQVDGHTDNQRGTGHALHGPVAQQGVVVAAVGGRKSFFPLHLAAGAHYLGKGGRALLRDGHRALAANAGFGAGFAQHPGAQGGVGLGAGIEEQVAVLLVEHRRGGGHLLQHALVEYPLALQPLLGQPPAGNIAEIQRSGSLAGHRRGRHEVVLAGHGELAGAGRGALPHGPGQRQQRRQHFGRGRAQHLYQGGGGGVGIKQLAAGSQAQNGIGVLFGHGGQQALALLAPVRPGHVAVADEAARPGLVEHEVVEHYPAAIAQQEGLAEHGFAGDVERPNPPGKSGRVGKRLVDEQLARREGRPGHRLQAKQAPKMGAHVLNLAAAIHQHHAQA